LLTYLVLFFEEARVGSRMRNYSAKNAESAEFYNRVKKEWRLVEVFLCCRM